MPADSCVTFSCVNILSFTLDYTSEKRLLADHGGYTFLVFRSENMHAVTVEVNVSADTEASRRFSMNNCS